MFEKKNYELFFGNCVDRLKEIPEGIVQCVVTSPPFFSLRNYGTEPQIWGGEPQCSHFWGDIAPRRARSKDEKKSETTIQNDSSYCDLPYTQICSECGAWKGELGCENNPEQFIQNLITVFNEVWRVLREDGVLFINIGDTYWNNAKVKHGLLKEKDMCLVPQRLAIAMQEYGWYVRNEIIWSKKSGLPESMKDRFSRNHETIWMFTKNADYYFDQDAVRVPHKQVSIDRVKSPMTFGNPQSPMSSDADPETFLHPMGANRRTVWEMGVSSDRTGHVAPFCKELPTIAVKVATSEYGACGECRKPYSRDIERNEREYIDKGWKKDCECECNELIPCVVLDPFNGSGSTGEVAMQLGRRYIGIELSKEYLDKTILRFDGEGSLF